MKVLVIGGGGREHTIAWSLASSGHAVSVCPGNPGMRRIAQTLSPPRQAPDGYLAVADHVQADLTIVGPETPLVDGIVDLFHSHGKTIFGPTRKAARLEGSKIFSKNFMERAGIPTARFVSAESPDTAREALRHFDFPVVLKADGLAAGKGVVIAEDRQQAELAIDGLMTGSLVGNAGSRLVIEECLRGEEVSFIVISDGDMAVPLEPSQDHKAIFDNDKGPNTGGMGAYSDSRILTPAQTATVMDTVIHPTLDGLKREGAPFRGFLYAGLMLTSDGPRVLEYNVRLGDPEAQPLLHRLDCDLGSLLWLAARGELEGAGLRWRPDPSVCVVLAAHGYPGTPRSGDLITGIEEAEAAGAVVFHAGTALSPHGFVTAGGRVLGVTASGAGLQDAVDKTYAAIANIHFDGMQFRKDIGRKGLRRYN